MASTDPIKALYRSRLNAFLRFAYRELNPNRPLIETWHIDVLAEHLDLVANGAIKRLIINLAPRMLKSHMASVTLPVVAARPRSDQDDSFGFGNKEPAQDLDRATRILIATPRCRALYPHLKSERRAKGGDLLLPHSGKRLSAVVRGSLIGRGADVIIIDDSITPVTAADDARRCAVGSPAAAQQQARGCRHRDHAAPAPRRPLRPPNRAGNVLGASEHAGDFCR
ncbi:MAG: hypothetical protein AB7O71_20540 [Hyphomicrobiaceae bacterium]